MFGVAKNTSFRATAVATLVALLVAFAVFLSAASDAQAETKTFSNPAAITINDSGPAAPYPSVINIKADGKIADLNVKLNGFTRTHDADVDVMLVGPGGQCAIVQSEVGHHDPATDIDLIFDDEATSSLPVGEPLTSLTSGTFKPTNGDDHLPDGPDIFPPPAPSTCENTALSVFDGAKIKGVWNLYVSDNTPGDVGQYEGGWGLEITKQK